MFEVLKRVETGLRETTTKLLLSDKLVAADFTNVAHYYYVTDDREVWEIGTDMPQCIPPWPFAWIEFQTPNRVRNTKGEEAVPRTRWAAQVIRAPSPEKVPGKHALFFMGLKTALMTDGLGWLENAMRIAARIPDCAHVVSISTNVMSPPRPIPRVAPIGASMIFLDERGDPLEVPGYDGTHMLQAVNPHHTHVPGLSVDDAGSLHTEMTKVVLLGFSLSNCKNVAIAESLLPRLPRRRAKKRKGHSDGLGRVTYRTLEITPMGRSASSGKSAAGDGSARMHICRGHFKDYRAGGGLFGKLRGLYWWESHLRGDAAKGRVHKDYRVTS